MHRAPTDEARIPRAALRSPGDPILGGAANRLINPITNESGSILLPPGASFWTGLGNPASSLGYKYPNPSGAKGPCKLLLAKRGKLIKARCLGTNGTIPFSLNEATQDMPSPSIHLGAAEPQCTTFGGTVVRDRSMVMVSRRNARADTTPPSRRRVGAALLGGTVLP